MWWQSLTPTWKPPRLHQDAAACLECHLLAWIRQRCRTSHHCILNMTSNHDRLIYHSNGSLFPTDHERLLDLTFLVQWINISASHWHILKNVAHVHVSCNWKWHQCSHHQTEETVCQTESLMACALATDPNVLQPPFANFAIVLLAVHAIQLQMDLLSQWSQQGEVLWFSGKYPQLALCSMATYYHLHNPFTDAHWIQHSQQCHGTQIPMLRPTEIDKQRRLRLLSHTITNAPTPPSHTMLDSHFWACMGSNIRILSTFTHTTEVVPCKDDRRYTYYYIQKFLHECQVHPTSTTEIPVCPMMLTSDVPSLMLQCSVVPPSVVPPAIFPYSAMPHSTVITSLPTLPPVQCHPSQCPLSGHLRQCAGLQKIYHLTACPRLQNCSVFPLAQLLLVIAAWQPASQPTHAVCQKGWLHICDNHICQPTEHHPQKHWNNWCTYHLHAFYETFSNSGTQMV